MRRRILFGGLLLALLALLAGRAPGNRSLLPTDRPRGMGDRRRAGLTVLMMGVSELGTPRWATAIVALATALLVLSRRKLEALFVLATLTGPALSLVLKVATRRARPYSGSGDRLLYPMDRYSFPSGHVVLFEVFYGFVAYLAFMGLEGTLRWAVVVISSVLILLVGPSRVFLGAHWTSDVAAGYLIGGLWLALLTATYRRAQKNLHRRDQAENGMATFEP